MYQVFHVEKKITKGIQVKNNNNNKSERHTGGKRNRTKLFQMRRDSTTCSVVHLFYIWSINSQLSNGDCVYMCIYWHMVVKETKHKPSV